MPRLLALAAVLSLAPAMGCGRVVFRPQQPPQTVQLTLDQQQQSAQREQELRTRAEQLDRDNQELETMLAQPRQQSQLLSDQIVATQDQLRSTVERLANSEENNTELKQRTEALVASVSTPAVGGIRPNSTLLRPLQLSSAPGVAVRQDGDVIRVAIAADQLFYTGDAGLQPPGERLLQAVTAELARAYPGHLIGLEGHTDGAPLVSSRHASSHHLSVAQATAAYDVLRRAGVPANQMFVIGHGANHPLVSNATTEGRQKNRRLELVVYPETVRQR